MTALITIITLVTMAAGAVVFWCSFCRLSKSSGRVRTSVMAGIWILASTSFLAAVMPLLGWWTPDPLTAALLVGVAIHQASTSVTWRHGVPVMYLRGRR